MSKPICHVMVGLPGVGKSTQVAAQCDIYKKIDTDVFVYSTDQFIEDAAAYFGKTYDEAFEDNIKAATDSMNSLLDDAIKEQKDVIWDQTNLGAKKRAKIINRMKQAGYQIRCECIVPPNNDYDEEKWEYRLSNRPGKTIPENVMASMIDSFAVPTTDEGFDMVTFYDMYGGLLGIDYGE